MKRGASDYKRSTASKRGTAPEKGVVECVILRENTNISDGRLSIKGLGNPIDFTFLPFETEEEAWKMYDRTTSYDDNLMSCHQILHHQQKWLLSFSKFETVEQYFAKKMVEWNQNGLRNDKGNWFQYIKEDFTRIFREVLKLFCNGIDHNKYSTFWAKLEESLVVTSFGNHVKFLPIVEENGSTDIDLNKLQNFMSTIIGLPFGIDDVLAYDEFNMPYEMGILLHYLHNDNLTRVGAKFLLWSPFAWSETERYLFLENLYYLMKTDVIEETRFKGILDQDPILKRWYSPLENKSGKNRTVFSEMLKYPGRSFGKVDPYNESFDVVRFCSNAFRHYNDATYRRVRGQHLYKNNIQKELAAVIPDLCCRLFDAFAWYAISSRTRISLCEKHITFDYL